jgi:hypothetical protein
MYACMYVCMYVCMRVSMLTFYESGWPKRATWASCMCLTISHPDITVKHESIRAFTAIAVTLYTDVFVYKAESRSETVFRKKVLQAICSTLLV